MILGTPKVFQVSEAVNTSQSRALRRLQIECLSHLFQYITEANLKAYSKKPKVFLTCFSTLLKPFSNETSEHISGALDNLLSSAEVHLVRSGNWVVVDNSKLMRDARYRRPLLRYAFR